MVVIRCGVSQDVCVCVSVCMTRHQALDLDGKRIDVDGRPRRTKDLDQVELVDHEEEEDGVKKKKNIKKIGSQLTISRQKCHH